jgi:hypothetical protein
MADAEVITGTPIVVGESKYVCWDVDHKSTQEHFLSSFDPSFFEYTCRLHESLLEGDHAQHAAVALRMTYSHVLETLFALLGMALQAPCCPAGWMLKYKNADLTKLVRDVTE